MTVLRRTAVIAVCGAALAVVAFAAAAFEMQGHRGARGLAPENTLPAFARALGIGVSTLELDIGVSRDGVVVVSHDPRLSAAIVRHPNGKWISGRGTALHGLPWSKLKTFDVGRIDPGHRYAQRFPGQVAVDGTPMPRLADVLQLVKKAGNDEVRFNIETKLRPNEPDLTLPPRAFVKALLPVLQGAGMITRAEIQSFDWRTLQHVQDLAPGIPTVYLSAQQRWLDNIQKGQPGASPWTAGFDIDDFGGSVPRLVKAAGGVVWSPYHREVDKAQIDEAHERGLRVVVWTVNAPADMERLIDLGVDGIITDYPDRLRRVLKGRGMPLPKATPVTP